MERISFSDKKILPLPDLIELQKNSYAWFWEEGLKELFDEVSPITDFIGRDLEVHFRDYTVDEDMFKSSKLLKEVVNDAEAQYSAVLFLLLYMSYNKIYYFFLIIIKD